MSSPIAPRRYRTLIWRALRLRCPRCGTGKLFRGYFRMPPNCSSCRLPFEREPGFYLGSIYVNYGLTVLAVTASYVAAFAWGGANLDLVLWSLAAFCLFFPIWFFRYARALWLAFDEYWDPRAADEEDKEVS